MNRHDITAHLSKLTEKHINPNDDTRVYSAKEVTFDYTSMNRIRIDYMQFKPINNSVSGIEKADVYVYEVKSSVEDFHSKNGHNFIGDFNYYVMPIEVFEKVKSEIPYFVGVLSPNGNTLKHVKNARRKNREKPISEILLMMFRSAQRELIKFKKMDLE